MWKNQEKLAWTGECEKAFQSLKEKLINPPVLAFPDLSREFILDTVFIPVLIELKLYYLNWMIMETKGSRAMNPHELGYCITRKESAILLYIFYTLFI